MDYSQETIDFTEDIKERAIRYGFTLVGIVSAKDYDAYPGHYIAHRDYKRNTLKTGDGHVGFCPVQSSDRNPLGKSAL